MMIECEMYATLISSENLTIVEKLIDSTVIGKAYMARWLRDVQLEFVSPCHTPAELMYNARMTIAAGLGFYDHQEHKDLYNSLSKCTHLLYFNLTSNNYRCRRYHCKLRFLRAHPII